MDPIEAARAEGRAEAQRELNGRTVEGIIRTAAAGSQWKKDRLDTLIGTMNRSAFIDADGYPNVAKIVTWVGKLSGGKAAKETHDGPLSHLGLPTTGQADLGSIPFGVEGALSQASNRGRAHDESQLVAELSEAVGVPT